MKQRTSAKEAKAAGDCLYCGRTPLLVRRSARGGPRAVWWCYTCSRAAYGQESSERVTPERMAELPALVERREAPVEVAPPPALPPQTDLITRFHAEANEPSRDPLATDHGGDAAAEEKALKLTRAQRDGVAALEVFVVTCGPTREAVAAMLGCPLVYVDRMLAGEMAPWPLAKVRITARMLATGLHKHVNAIQAWKAG